MSHSSLGAPVTDIDDFIAARPGPSCGPEAGQPPLSDREPAPRSKWIRWVAVPTAFVAVFAAWAIGRTTALAAAVPVPPATAPSGLSGFAELYVATFLTAGGIDDAATLEPFAVAIDDLDSLAPYERYVPRSSAVRIEPIATDYWSVVVAAEVLYRIADGYGPGQLEFYEVAVAVTDGTYTATAMPLPVAARAARVPYGIYGELRADADAATASFIGGFLESYFAGGGRLPRFVTADSSIQPANLDIAHVEVQTVREGDIAGHHWATASAVLSNTAGATLPVSVTVRLVDEGAGARIAELLPGPPPITTLPATSTG